jgi:hypothetical protein
MKIAAARIGCGEFLEETTIRLKSQAKSSPSSSPGALA